MFISDHGQGGWTLDDRHRHHCYSRGGGAAAHRGSPAGHLPGNGQEQEGHQGNLQPQRPGVLQPEAGNGQRAKATAGRATYLVFSFEF